MVFLGRLVAMKRPQAAIDAFRIVHERLPSARLWVIGDGPLLSRLLRRAPESVGFLGRLPPAELAERLTRAHVLVATSVREGWGLNVSEAALCGTPSIAYRVPGLADSVEASRGALVEPDPQALASALLDFFAGRLLLQAKTSTVPWPDVAAAVELRLLEISAS